VVAAWACYAERYAAGEPVPFSDRQEAAVLEAVARNTDDPAGFLRNQDWFADLADDLDFVEDYLATLAALRETADPRPEIRRLVQR
jgi:hypothetical protein